MRNKQIFLVLIFACGCNKEPVEKPLFTDITEESGLTFVHDPGVGGTYFMPESLGSGAAIFDYNNDQLLDIYLVNAGPHNNTNSTVKDRLFQQQRDGKFIDVTEKAKLGDTGYGLGAAAGDIENDGDVDLYITNFGRDKLYRNNGDGTFQDITDQAGIANSGWSSSAVFFDYNLDGFLDVYVTTYLNYDADVRCTDKAGRPEYCGPKGFSGLSDVLYRNNGNGTFRDVSVASGIASASLKGLGVITTDFNGDFYPDIYVANDGEPNHLWINQKNGTFKDQALELGAAVNVLGQPEASMGVTHGDIDDDGDMDLFMTHLRDEKNTLYRNFGASGFEDDSWSVGLAGPSIPFTGFGTGFFDFENDGDLDLAVVNGRIARGPLLLRTKNPGYWDPYSEPSLLFENQGAGKFVDKSNRAGTFCSAIENRRGLAFADIDNDGDVDLLVTACGGPARLYRNETRGNGWLLIRAMIPSLKRDAIGAKITIEIAGRKIVREIAAGYSYLCSNDARAHFGLGSAKQVDRIHVEWPGGKRETFAASKSNQILTLNQRHAN